MAIITNSASLTFNNERTASSNEVDTEVRESQSVAIVKDALLTNYVPGEPVGYVITVTNTGTGNLTDITVSDNLGSETTAKLLSYVDNSIVARQGATALSPSVTRTADSLVISNLGTLAAGQSITIALSLLPSAAQAEEITNTATVKATTPLATTVTASDTATITPAQQELVTLLKAAPSTVASGGVLPYTLIAQNEGTVAAENIVFTDTLPTGYTVTGIELTVNGQPTIYLHRRPMDAGWQYPHLPYRHSRTCYNPGRFIRNSNYYRYSTDSLKLSILKNGDIHKMSPFNFIGSLLKTEITIKRKFGIYFIFLSAVQSICYCFKNQHCICNNSYRSRKVHTEFFTERHIISSFI